MQAVLRLHYQIGLCLNATTIVSYRMKSRAPIARVPHEQKAIHRFFYSIIFYFQIHSRDDARPEGYSPEYVVSRKPAHTTMCDFVENT